MFKIYNITYPAPHGKVLSTESMHLYMRRKHLLSPCKLKHNNETRHKNSCQSRETNPGPLAPRTTETTESNYCCQAIKLFQRNCSKRK